MRTAIIVGATGLIGSEVYRLLMQDNRYDKIRILVRKPLWLNSPRMEQTETDFDRLEDYREQLRGADLYICLGTTMRKAGSKEAFRHVDLELVEQTARIAAEEGVKKLMVVSSIGANANSGNFYLKTKGEMEEAVKILPYEAIHIFRPSILTGDRKDRRIGEKIGIILSRILAPLMLGSLKKYRPIKATTVAKAMIAAAFSDARGLHFYESPEVEKRGRE